MECFSFGLALHIFLSVFLSLVPSFLATNATTRFNITDIIYFEKIENMLKLSYWRLCLWKKKRLKNYMTK